MLKNGWKTLGVLLVAYTLWMTFTTPLKPGLAAVSPVSVNTGANLLEWSAYAANLSDSTAFFLTTGDGKVVSRGRVTHIDRSQRATVLFNIADTLPTQSLDAVCVNSIDGKLVLPGAVFVKNATTSTASKWTDTIADPHPEFGFVFPYKSMLYESIRNLNFHVTMWFALLFCMCYSVFYSVKNLGNNSWQSDMRAENGVAVGLVFAFIGLITGSIWARFTWGAWWVDDTKLNGAAITVLIYLAYVILRGAINEEQKRARISAVYNIFAFVMMIVFIQVLPRMTDSLHPGNGGNPAFSQYDLDDNLRAVFYPAVLGWILIGAWIISIKNRMTMVNRKLTTHEE